MTHPKTWHRSEWFWVGVVLVILILVRFAPFWFQAKTLVFGDNYSLLVPSKLFTAYWLKQGIIPLWNPQIFAGIPWIGDVTQSVIYPSSLLFVWFSPALALNLTVSLHVMWTGLGAYLLAKDWVKSAWARILVMVLWMLSTQITGSSNNLSTIQALSWMPWVVWLGEGVALHPRRTWWLALVVLGQWLAGYPQHVVYSLVTAGVFSIFVSWKTVSWRKWLSQWMIAGILLVGLSAIAWAPFIPTLLTSTRMLQTTTQAGVGSLDPAMVLKVLVPAIFDHPVQGIKWGPAWSGQPNMVFYVGWLGLLAIVLTWLKKRERQDWWWFGVCGVTFVVALGEFIPGFQILQTVLPFFKIGRYPSMILIVTNLSLALWVASVLERYHLSKKAASRLLIGLGLMLGGGVVALALVQSQFGQLWHAADQLIGHRLSTSAFHTLERDKLIALMILPSFLVASAAALGSVLAWRARKMWLVVVITILDLLYQTQGQYIFAPQAIYPTWPQLMESYGKVLGINPGPQARILTRNGNQPYTDFGSYWEALVVRAPFSDSFVDSDELRDFSHPIRLARGLTPDWNMPVSVPALNGYTALLPQDYAALWPTTESQTRINFIPYVDVENQLLKEWSVGYYLVDHWFKVEERENLKQWPKVAQSGLWQLFKIPGLARIRYDSQEPVDLLHYIETPNSLQFQFENQTEAAIIIADRYDADWVAWVNGQPTTIENVRGMRRVSVPTGPIEVKLQYRPRSWQIGVMTSSVFALVWVVGMGYTLISSRKR